MSNDTTDGRIRGKQVDIEFNENLTNQTQELRIHQVATLPQKIQLWLIVILSLFSLCTSITSILSSYGVIPTINTFSNTTKCI